MTAQDPALPRVDLALQGGGSHGAFTWGVLDRLLQDDGIAFDAISGTSAGALNGAVLVSGFHAGGRAGARQALTDFWEDVGRSGSIFSPFSLGHAAATQTNYNFDKLPGYQWINSFFHAFSPYEFNPLNLNPLRDVLKRHVDPIALQTSRLRLFVTATSVDSGQAKVFTGKELSVDALLASACLPFLFQAVEIDGHSYWDGGYTGNPAIYPLIYQSELLDILLVKINPLQRDLKPTRSVEIIDRLSEITFNASLVSEMRAIAFVSRLVREGRLDAGRYKDLRMHMVSDDPGLAPFNASSKLNTDGVFLKELYELGLAAADRWLKRHRADIGVRQTLDVERVFLGRQPRARTSPPSSGTAPVSASPAASPPAAQAPHAPRPSGIKAVLARGRAWIGRRTKR
jgi:NTE family protein